MDNGNDQITAAILAAGFAAAAGQRQAISSGRIEDSLKEKYIEFLAFVREQNAAERKSAGFVEKKRK